MIKFIQVDQHRVKVTASTYQEMAPIHRTMTAFLAQQWGEGHLGGTEENYCTYAFFKNQTDILALRQIYPIPIGIILWDKAEAEREAEERHQERIRKIDEEKYGQAN